VILENSKTRKNIVSIIASSLLIIITGWVDYITGPDLIFSVFYLFPIIIVTWFSSIRITGILFSFLCAGVLFLSDAFTQTSYTDLLILFWSMFVHLIFFLIITVLLNRIKKDLNTEKMLAITDPLTGVVNSRQYYQLIDSEIKRHVRYESPFTLLFIDIDDFKTVNDTSGHSEGDKLLKHITKVINSSMRATDTIARLGGDEFSILLPEADFQNAESIILKIRTTLESSFEGIGSAVTFSIGAITVLKTFRCTADDIIKRADELMYRVKRSGKNGICHESILEGKDAEDCTIG
jgi:diguanylate cyclase (GGDEF)-like protein